MKDFDFLKNLELRDGIYYSSTQRVISYPEEGNQNCFQLEDESFWFNHRNNCIIEMVKHFSPNGVFFDIGGGNGFVAKGLEKNQIKSVLVEPGIQGALNAKRRELSHIVCSTLEDAKFKPNSINAAGLFDVVEHIQDDHGFLKSIYSFLDIDGLIFISVPAYQFLWSNEDEDAGHFRRYTVKSISRVLKENGFKVEFSSYIFSFLIIPLLLFRTIPSKLGFNKNSSNPEKHKKEHQGKKGLVQNIIDKICRIELSRIKKMKTIPFGTSCFIVARKK